MGLKLKKWLLLPVCFVLAGCSVKPPEGIPIIDNFDATRYLGTWYEIARLDHSFERGLEQVNATYDWRDDGGIRVINRGFDPNKQKWHEAQGKAYFVGAPNVAALKVSFFGPFYGGYNVIALDKAYQVALICGPDRSYLWILAREKTIPAAVKADYLALAQQYGFNTSELIWVKQSN